MLFLKFGKEEHLEQLKNGIVHFSPLASFIDDETKYRGDQLEGHILADPRQPFKINGVDLSPYIKEIKASFTGVESILSFSTSIIDYRNCHLVGKNNFMLNEDFVDEMAQFGSHVLLFRGEYLISSLEKKLAEYMCNSEYRPVFYCDKTNYSAIRSHFSDKRSSQSLYDYCFIKDATPYIKQNEWRFIIHDFENILPATLNRGINIATEFRTEIPIFETQSLKTAEISQDFLE